MVNSVARPSRYWLGAAAIVAMAALGGPVVRAGTSPPDLFTDIYNRSVLKQKSMRSIRAHFTETTESSLLLKPLVAHGTVVASNTARVLMTYTDPEPKILAMDGRTLVISWPNRRERERIDIVEVQKRIDHYFTNASLSELRSMFDIAARPDASMGRTDRIEMRPTRKQIQRGLERLELWIDRESDLLTQLRLTFPGGDRKTIALDDIVLNVPLTDEMFSIAKH